jgi:patatin-like phospholipase/acyl hydrolase
MSTPQANVRGKSVLCLDGGGVRGLSSLLVLEHLMEEIKDINKLPERPEPVQCFDLICGTSTGGLIALMLGHLGLSLSECIKQYLELSREIFGANDISKLYNIIRDGSKYATPKLESVLKRIAGDTTMNVPKDDRHTKVLNN